MVFALAFTGCAKKKEAGKITLKMGDCHPDRNGGVGSVLERINSEFMTAYPNVEFSIESYPDQPWQEKAMAYATANQLPDVFKWWTTYSMMVPFINAGHLEKLDKSDFAGFGYLPSALESCEINGSLYGVPASGDMWVLYANKALFEKADVAMPTSWEDIIASVPKFKAQNITPVVINGLEGWPLSTMFDAFAQRINGDFNRIYNAIDRKNGVKFTDPDFVQTASYIQGLVKDGIFDTNVTTSNYSEAQNQFVQEKAAMYMMGSWEMGMATNPGLPQSFRNNLDVIKFPAIQAGKGTVDDLQMWFGGNFVVSSKSANKAMALAYIKFLAERFGSYCWEMGAGFPAQKATPQPGDSDVSKKLLQFSAEARNISGKSNSSGYAKTRAFGQEYQELMRQLCSLKITPEVFCQKLDAAAELDSIQ